MRRLAAGITDFSMQELPHIRSGLEPFRYEDEKQHLLVGLKDPLELSDLVILVPQDLYYLLQFFDGHHSLDDLTALYMRKFNTFLQHDRLIKLIKKMDDALLLVNKRSEKRRSQIESAFRKIAVRPAVCAGTSYAEATRDLQHELKTYRKQSASDIPIDKFKKKNIRGMVVPHIDPRLGGGAYAAAYKALEMARPVDLFVIFGISHQFTHNPFVVTAKDFDTPLGLVRTDKDLLERVMEQCTTDFYLDEIVHRDEHSIEFQTVFLKHFIKNDFVILPVLCSFSHDMKTDERRQFKEFTTAMRAALNDYPGNICFIASVDFAHIGPYYGDQESPDSFLLAKVENFDRAVLDAVASQNKIEFENLFIRSNNKYHICGFPALRSLFEFLPPSHATLLTYDNAIMDSRRSTVTFAGMIFS